MTKNKYVSVVAFLFLVIAVVHAFRLLNGWEVMIGGTMIPMWASWAAVILGGYLSWTGFQLSRHS